LPFVEELRKVIENIPEEKKEDPTFKWVQMVSDKILKTLENMWIKPIESVWLDVDSLLHEPINVVPVEDKNMKWKIVQEYERGFVYEKNWIKKVITSSKVIIGQ
jgi:molecular chaperone GrpE (heat shock protein)